MFKNIGLEFGEKLEFVDINKFNLLDKELFKDCLYELKQSDTIEDGNIYYSILWKNLFIDNKDEKVILILDEHLNILIKHNRINKLKLLNNEI